MTFFHRIIISNILFLFSVSARCICQPVIYITGKVINEVNTPIEFANVVAYAAGKTNILTYAITDTTGNYKLSIREEIRDVYLVVSSLGYQKDTFSITTQVNSPSVQTNLVLKKSSFVLETIIIKNRKIPYKIDGDTTVYDATHYANGTERAVEDLIKKMPGVQVQDNGDIYYRGKRVNQVLLEDDALFGRKYSLGTKTMNAEVVDKIQFIDHYIENALLQNVRQSDELVMNIKIKEDRKKLLFGSIEAGGGLPRQYDASSNIFGLYKQHKLYAVGSSNNVGDANFSIYDYISQGITLDKLYDFERPATYFSNVDIYVPPELKSSNIRKNLAHFGAINLIMNPNPKLKIKVYSLLFQENASIRSSALFKELNWRANIEIIEAERLQQRLKGWEGNTDFIYQISKLSNIKLTTTLQASHIDNALNTLLYNNTQDQYIPQALLNKDITRKQRINYVRKLSNNRALLIDGAYYFDRKPQQFSFQGIDSVFTRPIFEKEKVIQQNHHTVYDKDVKITYLGINSSLKYELGGEMSIQSDKMDTHINQDILPQMHENFKNDLNLWKRAVEINANLYWAYKKTRYKVASGIGNQHLIFKNLKEASDQNKHFNYFNAGVGLLTHWSKRWKFSANYSFQTDFPDIEQLYPAYLFSSYRTLNRGVDDIKPLPMHNIISSIIYSNNQKLLEFHANLFYTYTNKFYGNTYFYENNFFSFFSKELFSGRKVFNVNADVNKFIPLLSSSIATNIRFSKSTYPQKVAGLIREVSIQNIYFQMDYTTAFNGSLDFGITLLSEFGILNTDHSSGSGYNKTKRSIFKYYVLYKFSDKSSFKIDTRQALTTNVNQSDKTYFFTNIEFNYHISKSVSLRLEIINLLNHRTFDLEQLSAESYVLNQYYLNPRFTLLYVSYKF